MLQPVSTSVPSIGASWKSFFVEIGGHFFYSLNCSKQSLIDHFLLNYTLATNVFDIGERSEVERNQYRLLGYHSSFLSLFALSHLNNRGVVCSRTM